MIECEFHPGVEAEVRCSRCGRDICANCVRDVIGVTRNRMNSNVSAQYCVFCHCRSSHASGKSLFIAISLSLAFMTFVFIHYLFTGKMIVFTVVPFIIIGIIVLFLFVLSYLIVIKGGSNWYNDDRIELMNGLTWINNGDTDITINELLELSPKNLKKHISFIIQELKTSPEDIQVSDIVKKKEWVAQDVFQLLVYLGKDIAHWCWRNDLSEKNQKRVALAFVYEMGINIMGKEKTDHLFSQCPFIESGTIDKILLSEEQAKSFVLTRQPAKSLPKQTTTYRINYTQPEKRVGGL